MNAFKQQISAIRYFKAKAESEKKDANDDKDYIDKGKKPTEVVGESFLYIKYREDDTGLRPADDPFWLSPDLNVYANIDSQEETRHPIAGRPYVIRCTVTNGGDMEVHSAVVEIYVSNATLGKSVGSSILLGSGTIPVPANGRASLDIDWTPEFMGDGHVCLLARVYSFSPSIDIPNDFEFLDCRNDRHIGQQNLMMVRVHESMLFDLELDFEKDQNENQEFRIEIHPIEEANINAFKCHHRLRKYNIIISDQLDFEIKMTNPKQGSLQKTSINVWQGESHLPLIQMNLNPPKIKMKKTDVHIFNVVLIDPKKNVKTGGLTVAITR